MDFRKTFDKIPESFDKYRPRYCNELFQELETVCDYTAIELGENFTSLMKDKFGCYQNFHIVNADFEKYGFPDDTYDLMYSAATIQWIPEQIAFTKTYRMLKPGGRLAMFMTRSDETSANPSLKSEIDKVYDKYFRVKQRYHCKLNYENVLNYGFENLQYKEWKNVRKLNADEYICYISTHCEHITLDEPYRSKFYAGIKEAIMAAGNEIVIIDTIPLYLVHKPLKGV